MTKMNPVVHFEMSAEDLGRAQKFYSEVFGWNMQQLGVEMSNYMLAGTVQTDDKMMPTQPGAINGGFYPRKGAKDETSPHIVISVDDIKEHMKLIAEAGGKVQGEPMKIPGIGTFVMIHDTEGNRVGILQPDPQQ